MQLLRILNFRGSSILNCTYVICNSGFRKQKKIEDFSKHEIILICIFFAPLRFKMSHSVFGQIGRYLSISEPPLTEPLNTTHTFNGIHQHHMPVFFACVMLVMALVYHKSGATNSHFSKPNQLVNRLESINFAIISICIRAKNIQEILFKYIHKFQLQLGLFVIVE